jgi:O-succinylbenzoate synthase
MRVRFQFRRYRLPFRAPVRTAHGTWTEREGVIVRLEDVSEGGIAALGWGEAAPIPWFGTETVDEVEAACRAIGEWVEDGAFEAVPAWVGCLRNALAAARAEMDRINARANSEGETSDGGAFLGVASLLPAGRAALPLIAPRGEIGFRSFKWKVGVGDISDELPLLDDVCAELPPGGMLRLDANGAWDRRRAERWLERCADRPIEFVEQPCFTDASQGATQQRRTEELLLGLAGDYPTPLALDESLVGDADIERWIGAGWPGVFVLKPLLIGEVSAALVELRKAKADVVFSSAIETAVGAREALRLAFAWKRETGAGEVGKTTRSTSRPARAIGFGVWPLFVDARFDGPHAAPFVRFDDVQRINPADLWTVLS